MLVANASICARSRVVRLQEFVENGPTVNAFVVGNAVAVVEDELVGVYSATQSTCVDCGVVGQVLGLFEFGATSHQVCC
jgi:hypothetical protein